jgi:hypothetical protein
LVVAIDLAFNPVCGRETVDIAVLAVHKPAEHYFGFGLRMF